MTVFDDDGAGPNPAALYVVGEFTHAGGQPASGIARWDGAHWSSVANGLSSAETMLPFDPDGAGPSPEALYVGGRAYASAGPPGGLARLLAGALVPVGTVSGAQLPEVLALYRFDPDGPGPKPGALFAGGHFATVNGIATGGVAMYACPPPCYPNCNGDLGTGGVAMLSVADWGCFQTRFVLGDTYADCDGDALLSVADFACYQTKFVLGCP